MQSKSIISLLCVFLLIVCSFFLVQFWPSLAVPCFFCIGFMQYHLLAAIHELAHYNFIPNRKGNMILGILCSSLLGFSFKLYQEQHNSHHKNCIEGDLEGHLYMPCVKAGNVPSLSLYLLVGDPISLLRAYKNKVIGRGKRLCCGFICPLIFHLLFVFHRVDLYVLFWVMPALIVVLPINRVRACVEHGLPIVAAGGGVFLTKSTKTNALGKLLFAPYGLSMHEEHHENPSRPWYLLSPVYGQGGYFESVRLIFNARRG